MIKRYSYLVETLVFLAIILGIGSLQGDPGFIGSSLHPFYFVILLMVMRYGYRKGFPAVLSSSSLYLALYLASIASIESRDLGHPDVLFTKLRDSGFRVNDLWGPCYQPLAFLAFGMFVGLLVEEDKKKIAGLTQSIVERENAAIEQQKMTESILAINAEISDQLIASQQSFNIVFEKTKYLFREDIDEVYHTAHHLLQIIIRGAEGYIFHLEGEQFRLAFPENDDNAKHTLLSQYKQQIEVVRQYHQFVRLDMIPDQELSPQAPVFIGPILHQATDTLYGLFVATELDLTCYNDNTYRTFRNLCRWIGEILYFRLSQYAGAIPTPKKRKEFPFLAEFGASRAEIQQIMHEIFHEDH